MSVVVVLMALAAAPGAYGQIKSDFSTDNDGWTCFDASANAQIAVSYQAAGGNPGGDISFTTSSPAVQYYFFNAPAKFLGNLSTSYKQNLSLDMMVTQAGTDNSYPDIQLANQGLVLVYQFPSKPAAGVWTSYTIPLNETAAGWHVGFSGGAAPTTDQMKSMLVNVTTFQIRVKFTSSNTGPYTGSLDNVVVQVPALLPAPAVSSISPTQALTGATVTINGSNFNAAAAQNAVFFGSVKATVQTASATQLTVTVPAGAEYGPVKVLNLSTGLATQSPKIFSPQFNNNKDAGGRIIHASFAPRVDLPVDATSVNHATPSVGDIDGDGWTDIITSEMSVKQISIWRNLQVSNSITGTSFATKVSFPISYDGKGNTVVDDFDGDGKLDIVVGMTGPSTAFIAFLRNTSVPGTISFAPAVNMLAYSYTDGPLHSADLDGDGRAELLATWDNSSGAPGAYFNIYQNLSTPGNIDFSAYQNFSFGTLINQSGEISTGDLNGDGKTDVAFVTKNNSSIFILQNKSTPGTISLYAPLELNQLGSANNVGIGDLDGDGVPDLAWSGYNTNSLLVSRNLSSPGDLLIPASFATPVTITSPLGYIMEKVAIADFNSDGKADVVLTGSSDLAVFQNQGVPGVLDSASFAVGVPFTGYGNNAYFTRPVVADLDHDGKPDIIASPTNGTSLKIGLFRNECFPVPVITSTSPTSGAAGNPVSLSGDLFQTGLTAPAVIVHDGPLKAVSSFSSNTAGSVTIPAGARSDRLSLTVHGLTTFTPIFPVVFPTGRVIDAASFATSTNFLLSTATPSASIAVADWDDDGKTDVAVIDNSTNGTIFQNTQPVAGQGISSSSLTAGQTLVSYYALTTFDIEGDGKLDLVSYNGLFQNTSTPGSISFAASPTNTQVYFTSASPADFNKDGKVDLAAFNNSYGATDIYENRSTKGPYVSTTYLSTFNQSPPAYSQSGANGGVVSADLDGDGFDDVLNANTGVNTFSYLRNLGLKSAITLKSFSGPVPVATASKPAGIVAQDIDGDGKPDVVITNNGATFMSVFRNTSTPGSISFAARVDFSCLTQGVGIAGQDLDGDGKPEIVVVHTGTTGSFTVFQNTSISGSISFGTGVNTATTGFMPLGVNVGDINQDNKPDILIIASAYPSGKSGLLVYQNNIQAPSIPINPQPTDASICKSSVATFSTGATGTNISYHWQKSAINPVTFSDMTDGAGFSATSTATLSVNTSTAITADQFIYRCRISGNGSPDVFTNNVSLTFAATPTDPVTSSSSGCSGTSVTLTATGASDGSFRWYTSPTGGTAIAGATNGSFTTPELATTTSYYVSISNGTCESNRVPAIATISACTQPPGENPPVIQPDETEVVINGTVTIPLSTLVSDPDNNLSSIAVVGQPRSGAVATLDAQNVLSIDYAGTNFTGIDTVLVKACDATSLCTTQKILIDVGGVLVVFQGISPNDDHLNETWIIQFIEVFDDSKHNHVELFNRWGDRVFAVDDYDNIGHVFRGLGTNGSELPSGVYFYSISFNNSTRKTLKGYLSLKR